MNIVLIFPRIKYGEHSPPLGLGYLAAVLEAKKHKVTIIDLTFEKNFDFLEQQLKQLKPQLVGITCQTTFAEDAFKAAKIVKIIRPDALLIIGGPHPTIMPEKTLAESGADIAVIGEGEDSLLEIVEKFADTQDFSQVKGIFYRNNDQIISNPERTFIQDLDTILFPARHLFDPRYFAYPEVTMISSRGCPYNCSFCQPTLKKLFGNKVRLRSPENVIAELQMLIGKYPGKIVRFHDDTFTWDKKWVSELCKLIKENDLKFFWNCKSRIDVLDREMIAMLRDAGCQRLDLGVESGSSRLLDCILNKGISVEKIKEIFNICAEEQMPTLAFIMVGSPTETPRDIIDTINLLEEINFDGLHVSLFTPFPGTDIFDYALKKDQIAAKSWSDYDFYANVSMQMEHFTAGQIKDIKQTIQLGAIASNVFRKVNGALNFMIRHPRAFFKYLPFWLKLKKLKKNLARKQQVLNNKDKEKNNGKRRSSVD
ncbi:MAG: B12-binding domain-containing radical SAM protein [Candidatus Omnitrophica bacterium]|nr:B12-binding domain-containing radical SAM protein [Candidatus Omnitrophota bacterium]